MVQARWKGYGWWIEHAGQNMTLNRPIRPHILGNHSVCTKVSARYTARMAEIRLAVEPASVLHDLCHGERGDLEVSPNHGIGENLGREQAPGWMIVAESGHSIIILELVQYIWFRYEGVDKRLAVTEWP
jgi:hypothetical protein